MKNGTLYAGKLKKFFTRLRHAGPRPDVPEPDDPLRRLATAILGVGRGAEEGSKAVDRLLSTMVDWNEVRVSSAHEVASAVTDVVPGGLPRCQQLISALRAIYRLENKPSLERLRSMGRREARQYLENLDGVDEHAVASVFLWSLGGHAIPVDDRSLDALRVSGVVEPKAARVEVQAFLERHINATDAKEFCLLLASYSPDATPSTGKARTTSGGKARKS